MKINRFIALAAIALLVVGAMGFLSYKALAQTDQPPAATDCDGQDDDAAEAVETEDLDDVEQECGPQDEDKDEAGEVDTDDVENEVEDANEAGEVEGVDEADEAADADGQEDDDAVPAGEAAITPEDAKAAALADYPGATVTKIELENEGGGLVYSIELDNGTDLIVDASSGAVSLEVDDD